MGKKPVILSQRIVASSRLFKVEELRLRFSNNEERIYERLIGSNEPKAVMVVALIDNNHFLMIEEYCAGTEDYQLTLPKGLIEKEESILAAANRELKEEAGYGAEDLEYITALSLSPGYMNQRIHIVLAKRLYSEKLAGDEPEPLNVSKAHFKDLLSLSQKQNFSEGRAIAALYIIRDLLISRGEFSL